MAGADDLRQLHDLASALLDQLEPAQRRTLLRRLSSDMRRTNQRRMAAQRAPDGTPWEKRKPRPRQAGATRPVRFLYPTSGYGPPRLVEMRSWIGRGDIVIGFDRQTEAMRTFRRDRVIKWLPAEGSAEPDGLAPEARGGRGRVRGRAQAMFRGLRSPRWMKTGTDADSAWVQFAGRAAGLALIHHDGGRDRVAEDGPVIDYPARPLLGFSPADEARILNAFIDQAGEALGWGRRAGG